MQDMVATQILSIVCNVLIESDSIFLFLYFKYHKVFFWILFFMPHLKLNAHVVCIVFAFSIEIVVAEYVDQCLACHSYMFLIFDNIDNMFHRITSEEHMRALFIVRVFFVLFIKLLDVYNLPVFLLVFQIYVSKFKSDSGVYMLVGYFLILSLVEIQ
ncbi:hypothetical protein ACJX0J_006052, partial [Zea mays]